MGILQSYFDNVHFQVESNVFMYLWIAQNICWLQNAYYLGIVMTILTFAASFMAVLRAICNKSTPEFFHRVGEALWVLGNGVWFYGEVHDNVFPNGPRYYGEGVLAAQIILGFGVGWLICYYSIVEPFKLLPIDSPGNDLYKEDHLTSKFGCCKNFRNYENIHILLWIGKDFAWSMGYEILWVFFAIPTFLVGLDFVVTVYFHMSELRFLYFNYVCQQVWIIGNLTWAFNEVFLHGSHIIPLWMNGSSSLEWWTAWIFVWSYLPILYYYMSGFGVHEKDSCSQHTVTQKITHESAAGAVEVTPLMNHHAPQISYNV